MNTWSIQRIINYPVHTHNSPALGELRSFYDKSGTRHEGSPYIQDHSLPYPGVDHDIIPMGEIWALDKDLKVLDLFTGGQTAENFCGVSKHTILHNVFSPNVHLVVLLWYYYLGIT